jgi:penicillin-binding protein 2
MRDTSDRYRKFSRRAFLIGAGQVGLLSSLIGRLYFLQVLESEKYRVLSYDNSIKVRLILPPRGQIVDCQGEVLVSNVSNFKVVVPLEKRLNYKSIIEKIGQLISLDEGVFDRVAKEEKRRWCVSSFVVKENLTWPEVTKLEVNAHDLPGMMIEVGLSRSYPYAELMSHVTGYVSSVSPEEQKEDDPLLHAPEFRIGKAGIEKVCDLSLRGVPGKREVEVNVLGRVVRELSRVEGKSGEEVRLTIDAALQQKIAAQLSDHPCASVVIMDVHSGAVKALVSTPGFDPNRFTNGIRQEDWTQLTQDPLTPLQNRAISGVYSPGSIYKLIVALAALESKIISTHTHIHCRGHMNLGNHRFHCWKKEGHGSLNVVGALRESCNIFFYEVSRMVGIDLMADMSRRLGLGEKTGIELSGEKPALVPTKEWKKKTQKGADWQLSDTVVVAIGQGYILATPLQLAVLTARIANGAHGVQPHLCAGHPYADMTTFGELSISQESLAIVRQGMFEVVNHPRGTARLSQISVGGVQMAGKTGTALIKRITMSERQQGLTKSHHRPWKYREHALFVGFAPFHNPQLAISVVVEHAGGGSKYAAPVAKAAMMAALNLEEVVAKKILPPKEEAESVKIAPPEAPQLPSSSSLQDPAQEGDEWEEEDEDWDDFSESEEDMDNEG